MGRTKTFSRGKRFFPQEQICRVSQKLSQKAKGEGALGHFDKHVLTRDVPYNAFDFPSEPE